MKHTVIVKNNGKEPRRFIDVATGKIIEVAPGESVEAFNPHHEYIYGPLSIAAAVEKPVKAEKSTKSKQ